MERCKTAREAVELIGSLIDEYGYYGTGETLIFGDPTDVWVIEMCGGTPSGTGGYWVAQKVPDGQVFVAANEFRIREIDANNPDQIFSKNLFSDAEKMGWWNPDNGSLDWTITFGAGEYSHPYYSLGRVWRIFDKIAPSQNLSPYVEGPFTTTDPFSIVPDRQINITEALNLYRDHYDGTEFDLPRGARAGSSLGVRVSAWACCPEEPGRSKQLFGRRIFVKAAFRYYYWRIIITIKRTISPQEAQSAQRTNGRGRLLPQEKFRSSSFFGCMSKWSCASHAKAFSARWLQRRPRQDNNK